MYEAAWYVWALVLTAVLGLYFSVGLILYRGGNAAHMKLRTVRGLSIVAVLVLVGWLAVSSILASSGFFETVAGGLPFLVVFPMTLGGLLLTLRLPLVSRALDSTGLVRR